MSTIKFAETHNLVAFLEKHAESKGFERIVDFLNVNPIKYALTVNPTIYTLCIQQFWDYAKVKTVNEDVLIQALIDGKKIIVTEASIRCDLQLQDAESTACLPNDTIFEELARMGTIASTIICLANNQKFNFSKYILDNMVKNLEARVKIFMFPRFVQVFVNHQLGDISHHKKIFVTPSLTKKVFANIKREGKEFSRIITHLFETMMVQASEEVGEGSKGRMNEEEMFGVNDLDGDEVIVDATASEDVEQSTKFAEKEVSIADPVTTASEVVTTAEDVEVTTVTTAEDVEVTTAATTPQIFKDELTLAQALIEIIETKPKARGTKDKGKGIMVEPEKPLKKKDQIAFDKEVARKLEAQMKAEMEEEERIAREKDEANIALIEQ
nr:hypothetical protein [Tanacetum cinerariifolium]